MMNTEEVKRRKTDVDMLPQNETQVISDDIISSTSNVSFAETSLGGLPDAVINHLITEEKKMIEDDANEISRQEARNLFEELLFSLRDDINAAAEGIEEEENSKLIKDLLSEVENWLYDDGEDASKDDYNAKLQNLKEKVNDFLSWAKLIKKQNGAGEEAFATARGTE